MYNKTWRTGTGSVVRQNSDEEDQMNRTPDNTRRQFVAGTAGALGGLAAGTGFVAPALGQDDENGTEQPENGTEQPEEDGEQEQQEPIENEFEDDIDILNYARTLEFLEANFYQQGLDNIGEEGLCTCGVLSEESALSERAFEELRTIQAHEEAHAETLGQVIESLGGEPVEEPTFDFGVRVEYPNVFLATAVQLEDVGVSAYAGAAPFIQNEDIVAPALGIHSVEARHASFLRVLVNETSFPNTVDEARSRSEVEAIISEFFAEEGEAPAEGEVDEDIVEPPEDDGVGNETEQDGGVGNETDQDTGVGNETEQDDGFGNETEQDTGVGNETDPGTDNTTENGTG